MICPVCKYEYKHRYDATAEERKSLPSEGDFFYHVKDMRRHEWNKKFNTREKAGLFACPKCGVAFIDITNEEERA